MADPTTTNLIMAQPLRGSDAGTWDTPINGNTGILDQAFGGVTSISPTNLPITLLTSQAQNNIIRLTGTLTATVVITMTSIYKFWTIDNQLTNSPSSFCVIFGSTSNANAIGAPPGQQDIFYDGTTIKYRNLGRIGDYWDYAGTTVPAWVLNSSPVPYLNCDGTSFSSATFPALANILGGNVLPDSRGSARYALNQGTARLSTAIGGIDGNTLLAAKTTQTQVIQTANLPPYTPSGAITATSTNPFFVYTTGGIASGSGAGGSEGLFADVTATHTATVVSTGTFTGNAQGGTSTPIGAIGTAYIGGITMIRAG